MSKRDWDEILPYIPLLPMIIFAIALSIAMIIHG